MSHDYHRVCLDLAIDAFFLTLWWIPGLRRAGYSWQEIAAPVTVVAAGDVLRATHNALGMCVGVLGMLMILWMVLTGGGPGGRKRETKKTSAKEGPGLHDPTVLPA